MNTVTIVILLAIAVDLLLNAVADSLNLRSLSTRLPPAFVGIYDADRYARAQRYLRESTRFGWVRGVAQTLVLLVFWFCQGFALLDLWVDALHMGPIASGLLYLAILLSAKSILDLPFQVYATFVIEHRYDLNRTSPWTFCADRLKAAGLALGLGGPLLTLVLWLFNHFPAQAWWLCWLAVTVFTLTVQYIAPIWILPLFNRYSPLSAGKLRSAVFDTAKAVDFPLKQILVMDGSRRSTKSNAFFTGFGRNKRIVLFDTLVKAHEVDELVAVLAHEMGHYKLRHILIGSIVSIVQTGAYLALLSIAITYQGLFDAFFVDTPSVHCGLLFFGLLLSPLELLLGFASRWLSRRHERQADRFAVTATGNPHAMVRALKKLTINNLSNLIPHPFYVALNYTHPPVLERIESIEGMHA